MIPPIFSPFPCAHGLGKCLNLFLHFCVCRYKPYGWRTMKGLFLKIKCCPFTQNIFPWRASTDQTYSFPQLNQSLQNLWPQFLIYFGVWWKASTFKTVPPMVLTGESTLGRNAKKPFEGWRGANVFFVEIHFLLRCYHLKIFAKVLQVF